MKSHWPFRNRVTRKCRKSRGTMVILICCCCATVIRRRFMRSLMFSERPQMVISFAAFLIFAKVWSHIWMDLEVCCQRVWTRKSLITSYYMFPCLVFFFLFPCYVFACDKGELVFFVCVCAWDVHISIIIFTWFSAFKRALASVSAQVVVHLVAFAKRLLVPWAIFPFAKVECLC